MMDFEELMAKLKQAVEENSVPERILTRMLMNKYPERTCELIDIYSPYLKSEELGVRFRFAFVMLNNLHELSEELEQEALCITKEFYDAMGMPSAYEEWYQVYLKRKQERRNVSSDDESGKS